MTSVTETEILSTTNYKMFSSPPFQRKVCMDHVKELASYIKKENLLHVHPIIVNSKYEIMSGQHRLEAAKMLRVPIFYVVIDTSDRFVVTANIAQRRGILSDSLRYYAQVEKLPTYVNFKKWKDRTKLCTGAMCALFGSTPTRETGRLMNAGKFEFDNPPEVCEDLLEKYLDFMNIINRHRFEQKTSFLTVPFCEAFYKICDNPKIDWKKFLHRTFVDWDILDVNAKTAQGWYQIMIKMYNKNCSMTRIEE